MENNKKQKKPGAGAALATVGGIMLLNTASSMGSSFILGVLVIAILVFCVYIAVKAIKKASAAPDGSTSGSSQTFQRPARPAQNNGVRRFADIMNGQRKEEAQVADRVYAPIREEFKKQYYEPSDVFDNYERDKQRRIQQLKVFLNNGIIGREEYQVLLRRYQADRNQLR